MAKDRGTPTLADVMKNTVKAALLDMHTCLPGRIEKVDKNSGKADVQPLLKRKFADGTVVNLPVIKNAPIATYRAGDAFISLPIKKGDKGMLIFAERSLDLWKLSEGIVNPNDVRKFDLSDAVFYPGLYSFGETIPAPAGDDLLIRNLRGDVLIGSKDADERAVLGEELVTFLTALIDQIKLLTVIGNLGVNTSIPNNAVAFEALKTNFLANAKILSNFIKLQKVNS